MSVSRNTGKERIQRKIPVQHKILGFSVAVMASTAAAAVKAEPAHPKPASADAVQSAHGAGHVHKRSGDSAGRGSMVLAAQLQAMRAEMAAQRLRFDAQQTRLEALQQRLEAEEASRSTAQVAAAQAQAQYADKTTAAIRETQIQVAHIDEKAAAAPPPKAAALTLGAPRSILSGLDLVLYGRADIALTQSNGVNAKGAPVTDYRLNQGEMVSRLGLTGGYSFNNDLKAIFGVESGLNLFNGNAGGGVQNTTTTPVLFNRGATAGFSSKTYGSLEGGLMYMAPFWVMLLSDQASAHDYGDSDQSALFSLSRPEALGKYLRDPPTTASTNFSKTTTLTGSNTGTALFYADSVRYRTPAFSGILKGLSAEVSYSMGQQAFSATPISKDGRTWAGNIIYTRGDLYLGYAHMDYRQDADLALSTATAAHFVTRDQTTDIFGARYRIGHFEIGGSDTMYAVSNAGGYKANAYGVSTAYDMGKNRIEFSWAHSTYSGANAVGVYGQNTGDGKGSPTSTGLGVSYLYNILPRWTYYTTYSVIENNNHGELGVLDFRSDNAAFGKSPSEVTTGMFYTF
jgi:predicted porin